MRYAYHGFINLHKPLGITSADAVNRVKRLIRPSKIGHAGTLDPLATGVLPLALGEGTKCINLLMDAKKTYEFSVTFGEARATDDAEGAVIATSDHIPAESDILAILPRFTGRISQTPPIYSALKVDGKRAYDLARAGQEVELKPREVTIHALEFLGMERVVDNDAAPSPNPLPQGERAPSRDLLESKLSASTALMDVCKPASWEALSPCGRGLGEGAASLRTHLSLAQEQQAVDRAQGLRINATEAEQRLWGVLRGRRLQGLKFRRQHPIEFYIADFVCLEEKLVIEVDGATHTTSEAYDAKRTEYFESQGFRVLRFWNNDVMENLEGVASVIGSAISRPLTQPSPARGEGSPAAPFVHHDQSQHVLRVARFRATVSKGTYIRSLGRDIAQALGSVGYISKLHRAAVGPFTDAHAISLDFLEESVHNAPPLTGDPRWLTPLERALDDIPALSVDGGQLAKLRQGQRIALVPPMPDTPQIAVLYQGKLMGLARAERGEVIPVRLLVF